MDLVSPFQVPSLIPLKYLVPSILTERETGLDTWSRLLSPTGDGISTLVPSFQTERGTGLDTWSRLFWLTGDGISTLVPSFVTQRGTGLDTWSRFFYLVHGPVSALHSWLVTTVYEAVHRKRPTTVRKLGITRVHWKCTFRLKYPCQIDYLGIKCKNHTKNFMLVTPMDSEKAILRDLTMCGIYMHFQLFNYFFLKRLLIICWNTCPKATMFCTLLPWTAWTTSPWTSTPSFSICSCWVIFNF